MDLHLHSTTNFYNFNLAISIEILMFCRTLRRNNTLNLIARLSHRLIQSHPRVFSILSLAEYRHGFNPYDLAGEEGIEPNPKHD